MLGMNLFQMKKGGALEEEDFMTRAFSTKKLHL